jgi:phospholipase C
MIMPCSLLKMRVLPGLTAIGLVLIAAGCGGGSSNVPAGSGDSPVMATLTASPSQITVGQTATLSWTTTNATSAQIDNGVGTVQTGSGSVTVTPTQTTTYTITATGSNGQATAQASVSVSAASLQSIQHVIFMLQENRSFDSYFGLMNPYRAANNYQVGDDGNTFMVDGIDDKLSQIVNYDDEGQGFMLFKTQSSCLDDMTSAWLESYGDVSRYDFTLNRNIAMDGFVHTAENFAKNGSGDGEFTDLVGKRAMAYYDQGFLPYYYFMASQFAFSDRWFAPVSSKSTPNRIATMTGGTTQGLVRDPFVDDHFTDQLDIPTIFEELDQNHVSWKIYYSLTAGGCTEQDGDCGPGGHSNDYPVTTFADFTYSHQYLYENPQHQPCQAPTIGSMQAVGDTTDAFCIDINHIAPLDHYMSDVTNNMLPSFAYIDPAYGHSDEHPGSGQSILAGQQTVAGLINALMQSPSWSSSVFFLSYDEPGGPYDHVPPVPQHSNDNTDASLGTIPDISSIAVNADSFWPCLPAGGMPTVHCDLKPSDPGANPNDAPAQEGFAAQLGFRLPNMVISPFSRKHYVGHNPMDHTAILKLVETRFIGANAHLTARDAAQPDLSDFFDFQRVPWLTPPTPPAAPAPYACTPDQM